VRFARTDGDDSAAFGAHPRAKRTRVGCGPGVVIVLAFCGLLTAVASYRIIRIVLERRG